MLVEHRTEVGRPLPSVDGMPKAMGRTRFVADITVPGMLHAKMVPSGRPHARIVGLSIAAAMDVEGVAAVATAGSCRGENRIGVVLDDQPLFADKVVRYEADCVAVVGAESIDAAETAAGLVEVRYEDLEPITTTDRAEDASAVSIHDGGNLAVRHAVTKGDVDRGERDSSVVVDETLWSPGQEHAYLEPLGGIAVPSADGSMEILAATQCPFYVRTAVARCLGIPLSKVRVLQMPIGGGFGGKEDVPSEICARIALLASVTGRPVKIVLTREEDIAYSSKRHPMQLHYRMGCNREGQLQFADIEIRADVGAYATLSPIVLFRSTVHATGPYDIPNVRITSLGFYTNTPPKGAMRGFGTPQVAFACEAVIDEMARRTGLDPFEFRLRNAMKVGSSTATGQVLGESVGFTDTLKKARELVGHQASPFRPRPVREGVVRASGMGSMFYGVSLGAIGRAIDKGTARVEVMKDCSVSIFIGCTDMGQGTLTVIAQIAAEVLGIGADKVIVNHVDTDAVPDSGPTVASRATVMSGNAVVDACLKIRHRLVDVAGSVMGGEVTYRPDKRKLVDASGNSMSIEEAVRECHAREIDLSATGRYDPPECSMSQETGQGRAYYVYSFATDVAEVEVDTRTGHVDVVSLAAVHDSGTIINPLTAASQVEGGLAQGIGLALREHYRHEGGRVVSGDLAAYLVPTSLDVCDRLLPEFVECPSQDGPFGAKGLGEPAIIPAAAAIANAVSNALGVRVRRLPIEPEWVCGREPT